MDWVVSEFKKTTKIDITKDLSAMQRLRDAAEQAKIELTTVMQTTINLPYITADASGPKNINLELSRSKFEQLTDDLTQATLGPVRQALTDAKLEPEQIDKILLVGGATRMPQVVKIVRDTFGKQGDKTINPDECVALGAAAQGGVLAGEVKDIVLLDITPLTLSVETLGGVATPLIERNTTIPTRKGKVFTTAADGQTGVEIHVTQGERPMSKDNMTLGRFQLVGIPPAPRGTPQIEVSFDIDANGIVNVTAKDLATGNKQSITITATTNLSDSDVQRMVKDAERYAQEDTKHRTQIETKNNADQMIYQGEKLVKEFGDKVPEDLKKDLQSKSDALRKAIQSDDFEKIKSGTDALQQVIFRISEKIYASAAPGGQGPQGPGGPGYGEGPSAAPRGGRPKKPKPPPGKKPSDEEDEAVDVDFEDLGS
jgi:molecular chaperone DnaK